MFSPWSQVFPLDLRVACSSTHPLHVETAIVDVISFNITNENVLQGFFNGNWSSPLNEVNQINGLFPCFHTEAFTAAEQGPADTGTTLLP